MVERFNEFERFIETTVLFFSTEVTYHKLFDVLLAAVSKFTSDMSQPPVSYNLPGTRT